MSLLDANGNIVAKYTYDAWGNILSITDSNNNNIINGGHIAHKNPLRYRGYYYDDETGFYYLQSRYYDPVTGRFINADGVMSDANGSVNGYNLFAYCFNNPVNMTDDTGNWPQWVEKVTSVVINGFKKVVNAIKNIGIVKHDVPVYNQGNLDLCWAYSQTMVESFQEGNVLTAEQADNRAREIAVSVYGEDDWNQGGWPTNLGKQVSVRNNLSLLLELKKGPIYGYYAGEDGAHLIVITGINIWDGTIYTNNPWGVSGSQTREEFLSGFIDMPNGWNMPFVCAYRIE